MKSSQLQVNYCDIHRQETLPGHTFCEVCEMEQKEQMQQEMADDDTDFCD